ncbi:MAG: efflux RND transporter periplasmic adaptor subunit [Candidatus Thiodiazotropha sp.]
MQLRSKHLLLLSALFTPQAWCEEESLLARAVLKAQDRAVLSSELAAQVNKLPLHAGEQFQKGSLLVGLDCALYQAQAEKVEAEHKAAKLKLENARQLDSLGSIGALDVALAQAKRAQTEAELHIARLNTERCEIRAPYDGRVVTVLVNRFENVRQQQELIEIVRDAHLEAEIVVPASWLAWLNSGQSLVLHLDDTDTHIPATVTALSPVIDTVSQTLLVRVKVKQSDSLIPGMSATADFASNGIDSHTTAENSGERGIAQ